MRLPCSFEELAALTAGAERTLHAGALVCAGMPAPSVELTDVEALIPRLNGDLELATLADQQSVQRAIECILDNVRQHMDHTVIEQYVGAEDAVVAYFDYAHVLTMRERVRQAGKEMEALIELMTGALPTEETAQIAFED